MPKFSRRDFLKLASVISGGLALSNLAPKFSPAFRDPEASPQQGNASPNLLIFVFDAMSASNLSLYGYTRKTTPNLERFAQRATVYNAHYSAGSFTTSGTASLLTGLYPWTHRAINEAGLIARNLAGQNLFRAVGEKYYRLAYSQNMWPNYFFGQFQPDIQKILSPAAFSLVDQVVGDKFGGDLEDSHRAFDDFLFQDGTPPASLVFGLAERILLRRAVAHAQTDNYPRGIPRTGNYPIFFQLKDVFDGLITTVEKLSPSSLAYLHLWSPHAPYRPDKDFDSTFIDGWRPKQKPEHVLGDHIPPSNVNDRRRNYDEYIANLDAEFGRLLDSLEAKGILDQSYVVVTSDHGEFFERGVEGHISPLLYDPVIRVPLLISSPGQKSRQDVNAPTNSVDVLPTLAHLTRNEIPNWCEGQALPSLGGSEDPERSIYMMDAKVNPAFGPLSIASFAIRKGKYKLSCYRGYEKYEGKDQYELYDMESDPEELNDLYPGNPSIAKPLQDELVSIIETENSKYKK
jgi:arylsulfatase A-like enzyme